MLVAVSDPRLGYTGPGSPHRSARRYWPMSVEVKCAPTFPERQALSPRQCFNAPRRRNQRDVSTRTTVAIGGPRHQRPTIRQLPPVTANHGTLPTPATARSAGRAHGGARLGAGAGVDRAQLRLDPGQYERSRGRVSEQVVRVVALEPRDHVFVEEPRLAVGPARELAWLVSSAGRQAASRDIWAPLRGELTRCAAASASARGNIRGNIQIVLCVRIVRAAGRYGRSGTIGTDMTGGLPG
jgi:hypothetical protein